MAIKKFKIEASELAKKLAKKPVKASDGEWDKAVIGFIDTIPNLPEQGKVISKTYKGWPIVIVGLGNGKCLYHSYLQKANAASDIQFIRGLIKRGDAPEKAVENLGFKTYTRGDVEGACSGKKSVKSAAKRSVKCAETNADLERAKQNIVDGYNDEYDRDFTVDEYFKNIDLSQVPILYTTIGGVNEDEHDYQLYADLVDPKIIVEIDGDTVYEDKFPNIGALADDLEDFDWQNWYSYYLDFIPDEILDGDSVNSACGGKKSVNAGRDKLKARKDWAVDVASRYSLFNGKNGDIENSNNKAELIRKCRRMSDPAWVEDNMLSGIVYNNDAQTDVDNADNPNYKPRKKSVKSSARRPVRRSVKAADSIIKRYSDVVPKEDRKYWYFTTHGLGPGMIPKGINVLKVQEGQNRNGTWGDFILLDAILNTDELKQYDLIELAPKDVNASTKRKPMKKSVKASASAKRRAAKRITSAIIGSDKIVMNIDGKEVYEGRVEGLADTLTPILEKDTKLLDKFEKWCEYYAKSIDTNSTASDIAYAFAKSVKHSMEDTDSLGFYVGGGVIDDFDIEVYSAANKDIDAAKNAVKASKRSRNIKASAAAKRRAKKSVKASKYYEITDHYNDEVGRADTEDEARELAKKLVRENDVDHYDIFWVDTDPDSTDDTSYIDTVYADKPFSVEGYYGSDFRGLSDSDTFYELRDALEHAQELLSRGNFVRMECENAGGRLEITPDEYEEFMMTEPEYFEDLPKLAEWLSDVRAERMDSYQEPWLDNWQYNTDIGMSTRAVNCSRSEADDRFQVQGYIEPGFRGLMEDEYFRDFEDAKSYAHGLLMQGYDVRISDDVSEAFVEITSDEYQENFDGEFVVNEDIADFQNEVWRSMGIDASIGVKAALGNKNKTDYASNPIYELDKYVKDLAEGVAAAAGITLTYQVSDEAITFIDGDGTAVFIQPISEITPEPDDLENDIQELVSAIQYEDSDNPEYWPTDTTEDDHDYATRAVQMSVDDELEPVMGEGEDIGYGIDSYGETIDESTVNELYRIAERDILPKTELAKIDPYVSIDEDSWDFYFGGISNTGMMGVVKFYIHFKLTSDNIDLNEFVIPEARLYPDFKYYTASLDFDIYTENGKVTDVVLESADIYKSDNSYDTYQSDKFKEAFNVEAIENYIEKLAAPAVEEIYNAVSNL